jgi:sulfate adenylyltransferase subunit 2
MNDLGGPPQKLPPAVFVNRFDEAGNLLAWNTAAVHAAMAAATGILSVRSTERTLDSAKLLPESLDPEQLHDELQRGPVKLVRASLLAAAKRKRHHSLVLQLHRGASGHTVLFCNDARGGRHWVFVDANSAATAARQRSSNDKPATALTAALTEVLSTAFLKAALDAFTTAKTAIIWPHGAVTAVCRALVTEVGSHTFALASGSQVQIASLIYKEPMMHSLPKMPNAALISATQMSHLDRLEAESIYIMREVVAQAENPVMLYSVGKDSSVMLHLAKKAFYPSPPPFPLMHVDTRWKFSAMYDFRDQMAKDVGMDLLVHINPDGIEKDINPFDHGSALHTDVMKTEGLKQALDKYGFDVAFGGARRDEEKSRAKERVFSFRTNTHRWDPKNQRPELWNLYNGYKRQGESIRAFPISNWTELDIWQYIYREQIPLVPLYFSAERPVVDKDGMLMMVDDDRMRLFPDDKIEIKRVRFRTLGCYPLTGAVESDADSLSAIVLELLQSKTSERQGRAIDSDASASMEKKKVEGYF